MKNKLKTIIIGIMLAAVLSNVYARPKKTKEIANPVKLEVDTLAFDEDSLLGIYDDEGNLISNFSRIEKKNNYISPFKVLGDNEEHLYTVSYDEINDTIVIVNKDRKKGKIFFTKKKGLSLRLKFDTVVSFFDKPFALEYTTTRTAGRTLLGTLNNRSYVNKYTITYNSKPVIKKTWKYDYKKGQGSQELIVDTEFLRTNKIDCVVWILALQVIDEVSAQKHRKNG